MRRAFSWRRTDPEPVPDGALSAALVAAWLALTVAFTVVGVSLVATVVTALGHPQGVLTFLATVASALGACAVAPTLAKGVVSEGVERVAVFLDRDGSGLGSAGRLLTAGETEQRNRCQTPSSCCC
jgi:hypothetical protein